MMHKSPAFVDQLTPARFSHGICSEGYETRVKPELARMLKDAAN